MQDFGIEPQPVRPDDGARLCVHAHLTEVLRIPERLEHHAPQLSGQIDLPVCAVVEHEKQSVVGKGLNLRDADHPSPRLQLGGGVWVQEQLGVGAGAQD